MTPPPSGRGSRSVSIPGLVEGGGLFLLVGHTRRPLGLAWRVSLSTASVSALPILDGVVSRDSLEVQGHEEAAQEII